MNGQNNQLPNQQPQYYQPRQQPGYQQQAPVINIGDWIVTSVILAIPPVSLIMAFVWGPEDNTNPNRANYCKAWLIFIATVIAFHVLLFLLALDTGVASSRYN